MKYDFFEKTKKVHGDKYDYSKVEYVNTNTKVCIICPIHGEFLQTPHNHIRGCGCPKCAAKIKGIVADTGDIVGNHRVLAARDQFVGACFNNGVAIVS